MSARVGRSSSLKRNGSVKTKRSKSQSADFSARKKRSSSVPCGKTDDLHATTNGILKQKPVAKPAANKKDIEPVKSLYYSEEDCDAYLLPPNAKMAESDYKHVANINTLVKEEPSVCNDGYKPLLVGKAYGYHIVGEIITRAMHYAYSKSLKPKIHMFLMDSKTSFVIGKDYNYSSGADIVKAFVDKDKHKDLGTFSILSGCGENPAFYLIWCNDYVYGRLKEMDVPTFDRFKSIYVDVGGVHIVKTPDNNIYMHMFNKTKVINLINDTRDNFVMPYADASELTIMPIKARIALVSGNNIKEVKFEEFEYSESSIDMLTTLKDKACVSPCINVATTKKEGPNNKKTNIYYSLLNNKKPLIGLNVDFTPAEFKYLKLLKKQGINAE